MIGDDRDLFCENLRGLFSAANCMAYEDVEDALPYLRDSQHIPNYIFLMFSCVEAMVKQCFAENAVLMHYTKSQP